MKKFYKIAFYKDRSACVELSQEAYEKELKKYMDVMSCYEADIPSMWRYRINICGDWCNVLLIARG